MTLGKGSDLTQPPLPQCWDPMSNDFTKILEGSWEQAWEGLGLGSGMDVLSAQHSSAVLSADKGIGALVGREGKRGELVSFTGCSCLHVNIFKPKFQ